MCAECSVERAETRVGTGGGSLFIFVIGFDGFAKTLKPCKSLFAVLYL